MDTDSLEKAMRELPCGKKSGLFGYYLTLRRISETIWSASYENGREVRNECRATNPLDAIKQLTDKINKQ